ncbi:hypothetical protein JOD55_001732 [Arcanobacterium pluranimalium]|nr:hypothetical protein [Arcanobacterium pluranimalium]
MIFDIARFFKRFNTSRSVKVLCRYLEGDMEVA